MQRGAKFSGSWLPEFMATPAYSLLPKSLALRFRRLYTLSPPIPFRTAEFANESVATLRRRVRGKPEPVWLQGPGLYPPYYTNTFHFQTDGWLSGRWVPGLQGRWARSCSGAAICLDAMGCGTRSALICKRRTGLVTKRAWHAAPVERECPLAPNRPWRASLNRDPYLSNSTSSPSSIPQTTIC